MSDEAAQDPAPVSIYGALIHLTHPVTNRRAGQSWGGGPMPAPAPPPAAAPIPALGRHSRGPCQGGR